MSAFIVTGLKGFEPLMTESESVALPLGDTPMAPEVGLEPTTDRLTADCSTTELFRNVINF